METAAVNQKAANQKKTIKVCFCVARFGATDDREDSVALPVLLAGSGIKCHQCNSYTEAECVDPFFHPDTPDKPKTDKFLMECPNNGKEHFCRKIYQNGKSKNNLFI